VKKPLNLYLTKESCEILAARSKAAGYKSASAYVEAWLLGLIETDIKNSVDEIARHAEYLRSIVGK
jgi:hypothetical protein